MRDTTLLRDMLIYLKNEQTSQGFGRFQKSLIKRIEKEIALDPLEVYKLASTFLSLFANPSSDCQPTRPWEKLNEKMRIVLNKKRSAHVEMDPFVLGLINTLLAEEERKKQEIRENFPVSRFYPFKLEDLIRFKKPAK